MKLVKESLDNDIMKDSEIDSISIYRVKMVKEIEFTNEELKEYMSVNSIDKSELKKACTGLAKVKWRNAVNNVLTKKAEVKTIDDKSFKYYL